MFQACILSGHEGSLGSEQKVYVTFMGACELRSPSVARQIAAKRKQQSGPPAEPVKQVFVTLMGATEIKLPTLTEEYVDFRDLLHAGKISLDEWDRHAADGTRSDVSVVTFTVMGGFSDGELPTDDEEIDALALQRHLGSIPDDVAEVLKHGIGQRGGERRATLRRAISALTTSQTI